MDNYEQRPVSEFYTRSFAYRAWCVVAFRLYLLVPHGWVFSKPALWLLQYAGHYAYADNARLNGRARSYEDADCDRKALEGGRE